MGCLVHPKTCRGISWSNFWGLRSPPSPVLRHLIHGRYLEEGEFQKEQKQILDREKIQPPEEEGAVKPNTESQVEDSSQRGLDTLGQQQWAEVRLSCTDPSACDRSCMVLFLAKSIPAGIQCEISSAKGRCLGVLVLPDSGCGHGCCFSLSFLGVKNRNNTP